MAGVVGRVRVWEGRGGVEDAHRLALMVLISGSYPDNVTPIGFIQLPWELIGTLLSPPTLKLRRSQQA